MNIYFLDRFDKKDYDEYHSMVVVAESEERAIELSLDHAGNAIYHGWHRDVIIIKEIGKANEDIEEGIILVDFLNG